MKLIKNTGVIGWLMVFVLVSWILVPTAQPQSSRVLKDGKSIEKAERMLSGRGYWITRIDRESDSSTYHAITAFQKVEGLKRNGRLTAALLSEIEKSERPAPAYIGAAHVEVDIIRQVLFLVNGKDIVTHILPVSTGSEKPYYQNGKRQIAHTPRGIFTITRQIKGTRRAPLGNLYHPNYFFQGWAIHGSGSVPFYPASHGCVRIPRFASKDLSDLLSVGMSVVIYDDKKQVAELIEGDPRRQNAPFDQSRDIFHAH